MLHKQMKGIRLMGLQNINDMVEILSIECPEYWEQQCDDIAYAINILSTNLIISEVNDENIVIKTCKELIANPKKCVDSKMLKEEFEKAAVILRGLQSPKLYLEYHKTIDSLYENIVTNLRTGENV